MRAQKWSKLPLDVAVEVAQVESDHTREVPEEPQVEDEALGDVVDVGVLYHERAVQQRAEVEGEPDDVLHFEDGELPVVGLGKRDLPNV